MDVPGTPAHAEKLTMQAIPVNMFISFAQIMTTHDIIDVESFDVNTKHAREVAQ